jgi:hypothetical protein
MRAAKLSWTPFSYVLKSYDCIICQLFARAERNYSAGAWTHFIGFHQS